MPLRVNSRMVVRSRSDPVRESHLISLSQDAWLSGGTRGGIQSTDASDVNANGARGAGTDGATTTTRRIDARPYFVNLSREATYGGFSQPDWQHRDNE